MENLSGQKIQGYDLLERIGAGGFGAVYRAYQSTVGREVAVKVILPAFADKPEFIRRFEIEAQLVARLEHLHIVPLYDYWRDPQGAYIVMRWLRGGSLSAALQKGAFDLEPASLLLDQVASALATAHQHQIIHRDLKPANILLDGEGNAYLADFGIARYQPPTPGEDGHANGGNRHYPQSREQVLGSIQYLSPEQLRGQEATPTSDIYSLGITLYELLTGQHPFPDLNSVQQLYKHIDEPLPRIEILDPSVAEAVNEVIQKATAKNPKQRYADALAMAAAFRDSARLTQESQTADLVESLTRREQEILQLIIEGKSNKQIAQELFLELSTVKWHINRVYKKLGVRSRVQAIVRARELNLIVSTDETELESAQQPGISVILPEPANPYKGLRAFEAADNRDFFGREALIEQLLSRLGSPESGQRILPATKRAERFLAIVGPSGSGKSSLVKAGLIPALWSGQITGSEKWFIVDMLPGSRPLDDLEIALTRIAADQAGNLREHLGRDDHGLVRAAKLILPNDESELVLVVDQFEEIFTLVEDEKDRSQFMALIHRAVTDPRGRVRVIITLRADYYDRPLQYSGFGELVRSHLETLLPLTAEELERAIVNPAHQAGLNFESGLVATIIEDVNYRPGGLPLLQFALAELFEQRDGRMLTNHAYQALGGAAGALARRAEDLYQEQNADGRESIRQMFLRLVSVAGPKSGSPTDTSSPAGTRRRVLRTELLSASASPERLDEIVDTYARYRLLSLDYDTATRQGTVEVAHEAILREWDRLEAWLEESLVDLGLHRQLVRAAREWHEAEHDQSFLLRGARLNRFQSWAGDTSLLLTLDEQAYLDASINLREEKLAAERRRQEEEARLEGRAKFRLRALMIVSALALLVVISLVVSTLFFSQQQRQAETFAQLSLARDLMTNSQASLQVDPELSALLALKAVETLHRINENAPPELESLLHAAAQAEAVTQTFNNSGPLAFSPDGQMVAVGNEDSMLRVWNPLIGDDRWGVLRYQGKNQAIGDMTFSPDGDLLVTASAESLLKVWDAASGEEIGFVERPEGFTGVAFNPVDQEILTLGRDKSLYLWDLTQLTETNNDVSQPVEIVDPTLFTQTTGTATAVVYSSDGQRIAMFVHGTGIIVVDAGSGEQLLEIPVIGSSTSSIAFRPMGEFLAGRSGDLDVTVWDSRTGTEILTVSDASSITNVAFSPDGRYLATANDNGQVTLWDMGSGGVAAELSGHAGRILDMAFHPNGRLLATSAADGLTRIWDLDQAGSELYTLVAHEGRAHDVIYNAVGSLFASAGDDGLVKLWDAETGTLLHAIPGPRDRVHFPAFSQDGRKLAAANQDDGLTLWETDTGLELLSLASDAPVAAVSFNEDGTKIIAGGEEGMIHGWNALTGERLFDLDAGEETIMKVRFVHPGVINAWDQSGLVTAWDASTGSYLGELQCPNEVQIDADISADGRLIAVACNQVFLAEVVDVPKAGEYLYNLANNDMGEPTGVAFNPDGSILATVDSVGLVSLWDTETGKRRRRVSGPQAYLGKTMHQGGRGGYGTTFLDSTGWRPLSGVDISPDGRYLATAGSEGTINVYILPLDDLISAIRSRLSRDLSDAECQTYLNLPECLRE
jgi:WD40 repeat protein/serine/threonine protein kinase